METASHVFVTASELTKDGVKIFTTTSGSNRIEEALEDSEIIENLGLYDHEGWNDPRDLVKPVKAILFPPNTSKTPDRRLLELEDQIKFLLKGPQTAPRTSPTHILREYVKAVSSDPHPRNLNGTPRQNSFTFQKRVRLDPQPQALETSFEARDRNTHRKNGEVRWSVNPTIRFP
ncbi:hypothetical protein Tco_0844619 [Tanacetum coccineum]